MEKVTGKIENNIIDQLRWNIDVDESFCSKTKDTLVFAMIYSSPANFERRTFIRKSWGNIELFNKVKMK